MVDVLIWQDQTVHTDCQGRSSTADSMSLSQAMQRAIAADVSDPPIAGSVTVLSPDAGSEAIAAWVGRSEVLICPLTLDIPDELPFIHRSLYQRCSDREGLQAWVSQQLGVEVTNQGDLWLPIVWTARGPLYAEVIGYRDSASFYLQPIHLRDRTRQPLYRFAQQILHHLEASPAVYLIQFDIQDDTPRFDRLFPFPAAPALASVNVQTPDLFTCHWRCLSHQPILDVAIAPGVEYRLAPDED